MSTIIFGGTVSLISSATPSVGGYLIGYDIDGVLKQKDAFGNISPISGLTAGDIGTASLSEVLQFGNNTGSFNIVMGTSSILQSSNGNSEIKLDDSGNPHTIKITTNDGSSNYCSLDVVPNQSKLSQTDGTTFSEINLSGGSVNFVAGQLLAKYTTLDVSTDVFNLKFNDYSLLQGQIPIIESGTTWDSGSLNKAYLHLNSYNSNTNIGVKNSVVIGGSGLSASESDSVYVPQLVIQDSKVIKGSTGASLIQFTEWNDVLLVNTSQDSIIGIVSSLSSTPHFTNKNGVFLIDSLTSSTTPNIPSSNLYLSTQYSSISQGVENTVIIGGIGLNGTQSNTVYLGNNVNINNAFTLPNTDGVSGQILKTDGLGNITWQNENLSSATQSLYQVLQEGNDTVTEDIIMGTSTSIRSGNNSPSSGGSIFLDYSGILGNVVISTDNGVLTSAFADFSTNSITMDSISGTFNINTFDSSIITGSNEGLKYSFDYTATFVTYSLITKGYVDSLIGTTPSLGDVLSVGNTSSGYDIKVYNPNSIEFLGTTWSSKIVSFNNFSGNHLFTLPDATGISPVIDGLGVAPLNNTNYFSKWSSTYSLSTSSILYDNGSRLHIGGSTSSYLGSVNYKAEIKNYDATPLNIGLSLDVGYSTSSNVGLYSNISGTYGTSNYGIYVDVTISGTANTGVYINGTSSNNSLITSKGGVVFNEDSSQSDLTIKSSGNSQIFYVSGANDNIGVGTASPNTDAIIDIFSDTKSVIVPRLSATAASLLTPVEGMMCYVNSTNPTFSSVGFWGYVGAPIYLWTKLS